MHSLWGWPRLRKSRVAGRQPNGEVDDTEQNDQGNQPHGKEGDHLVHLRIIAPSATKAHGTDQADGRVRRLTNAVGEYINSDITDE